jgi:hypothetical protein
MEEIYSLPQVLALPVAVFATNFRELKSAHDQQKMLEHDIRYCYYLFIFEAYDNFFRAVHLVEERNDTLELSNVKPILEKQAQIRHLLYTLEQSHQDLQRQIEDIRAILDDAV